MTPILDVTLQGLQASLSNLDRIALNVANAQVPGFRRVVAAAGFDRALAHAQQQEPAAAPVLVHLDPRAGSVRQTGRDLDVALAGDGWFEVRLPDGPAYTRRGAFRLDGDGRLVTEDGDPVMGVAGDIRLVQSSARIESDGKVFDGAAGAAPSGAPAVGQLKVVRFASGAPAQRLSNGLLRFAGEPLPVDAAQVRQGALETANVNQGTEMVQLMQVVRHVELLQKVALVHDDMLGTAMRRLGDVN